MGVCGLECFYFIVFIRVGFIIGISSFVTRGVDWIAAGGKNLGFFLWKVVNLVGRGRENLLFC